MFSRKHYASLVEHRDPNLDNDVMASIHQELCYSAAAYLCDTCVSLLMVEYKDCVSSLCSSVYK